MRRGYAYAVAATLCWSTGGILQRQISAGAADQLTGRALFAFLTLLLFLTFTREGGTRAALRSLRSFAGVAVAVGLAVASGSFIVALNHTTVAHAFFFQALVPIAASALGLVFLRERMSPFTWLALFLAVAGIGVIAGDPRGGSLLGDALAALSPLAFAVVIVITRRHSAISLAPAACASQLLLVLGGLPFVHLGEIHAADIGWLALLGVGQQGVGLMLFTVAGRLLPAASMGLITLLESVLGSTWAWLGTRERPTAATISGGLLVIAAVAIKQWADRSRGDESADPEGALERVAGS